MMEEIRNLKRALEVEPGNAVALTRLANLYHDAGMWRQAADAYEKAIAAGRADANVITDLGVCYQQLKDFEKALDAFERAQKTDPSHWQSLYNIVIVAGFNLGRYDQAEAALERLEKVNPGAPNLGSLRENLNQARASRGRSPA
jgi:tetratricopeptide (TPR) repeat protein